MKEEKTEQQLVEENWRRYQYGMDRGHRAYTEAAKRLEGFYLGGSYDRDGVLQPGGHWNEADLDFLASQGRPAYEINQIKSAMDSAFGYQIANRMDISFKPRSSDSTKELAEVRSKVAMQIGDNNRLHWHETDMFQDGMIQQRGYLDNRIDFEDSMVGELRIVSLDPLDVIPDPDAASYDPQHWADVIVVRWLTENDIAALYGDEKAKLVQEHADARVTDDYDISDDGAERNRYGTDLYDYAQNSEGIRVHRVIDRQFWRRERMQVAVYPEGDIRQLSGDELPEQLERLAAEGAVITHKVVKRVRWRVSTRDVLLHDDWSPYDRFTVVPFFPFFRRGKTRGMVDNAVGPQQILNKAVSQAVHIINTTANSGWMVEEGSLANMTEHDLADYGSSSGVVISYRKNTARPEKIPTNNMPNGMDRLIDLGNRFVQEVTVPEAMRGVSVEGESGIAIQSRQHASQQILAVPLDNLSRTRHMEAAWIDYAIAKYYNTQRVYRITRQDPLTGKDEDEHMAINQFDPASGTYLNDMTAGEYDIVISEQPMQVTFENSQFQQIIEMREKGINIPDSVVVKHSNLSDKGDIISMMENAAAPAPDPVAEADAELKKAQAERARAEITERNVRSQYSAIQTAQVIAMMPQTAGMADEIYASAGGVDHNAPPVFPASDAGGDVVPPDTSTNPMTPAPPESPAIGAGQGIETQRYTDNIQG